MPKYRVLITDFPWPDVELERSLLRAIDAELIEANGRNDAALEAAVGDVHAILATWSPVRAPVIAAARHCRIVARMGIGLDNIDVAACTEQRVLVTNVPDYCRIEVAEHTLALLFALFRRVAYCHYETKQGHYALPPTWAPERIAGKTLGIVGLGTIGKSVAERARALGLNVLGYRRSQAEMPEGVTRAEWDELLENSDVVSLHVPLDADTRHMIGAAELDCMKPSAFLINTSRGGLIDHQALADALAANQLGGAALDVQDPEPPDLSRPPYNDPRVIVTPHLAFVSPDSLLTLRRTAVEQVIDALSGRTPQHVVNRSLLDS